MHLASRHKMLERRVYDVVLPWRRPNIYFFAKLFHAKKISVTQTPLEIVKQPTKSKSFILKFGVEKKVFPSEITY